MSIIDKMVRGLVIVMLVPTLIADPGDYMEKLEHRNHIAIQENQPLYLKPEGYIVKMNVAPEDFGGYDIGFGHKLTPYEYETKKVYGIDVSEGITREQALEILEQDIEVHERRARAATSPGRFDKLPTTAKQALTDYSFTGTIKSFPNFVNALYSKDLVGVLNNYKRFFTYKGKRMEMKKRNAFMSQLIKELVEEGYFKPYGDV